MLELDIERTRRQVQEHCEQHGIDWDALIASGSGHFKADVLMPAPPATDAEIERLVEDELAFLAENDWKVL